DYWHLLDIRYYDGLDDFFDKNTGPYSFFSTKAKNRYCDIAYQGGCYLVFGKETAGLPEGLLKEHPDSCVRLPMLEEARSLNLSNAVAVGVFEVLRQWDFPRLKASGALTKYDWEEY
ncbi:MAG TPA: tRNA (uridine(34)/cytosine(34)/5-carboxymethylaminomethyluridine(34)-2'-O)-methyltransferase TrmL, partial [Ruminococcaceae bacterium]|nr:tRNA (uridine(34)/cytosine(34)/5-carboxymethylaminomethyluridine(34)-2'-O)-methyltransferase TrmL [Oscillospiraceae bacterium]